MENLLLDYSITLRAHPLVPVQMYHFKSDSPFFWFLRLTCEILHIVSLRCFVLQCAQIRLDHPSEYLVRMEGSYTDSGAFSSIVSSVSFITTKQKYGPYGSFNGPTTPFCSDAGKVVGFEWEVDGLNLSALRVSVIPDMNIVGCLRKFLDKEEQSAWQFMFSPTNWLTWSLCVWIWPFWRVTLLQLEGKGLQREWECLLWTGLQFYPIKLHTHRIRRVSNKLHTHRISRVSNKLHTHRISRVSNKLHTHRISRVWSF